MAITRRLPLVPLLGALSIAASLPSVRNEWRFPGPEWARGPAWYLMTADDYREYRRLQTNSERAEFVGTFWKARDPIPETKENELEQEFWERVEAADRNFGQGVKPGWKTERGKVYILLGPPENYETDQIYADFWGSERWIYDLGSMPLELRLVLEEAMDIPADRRFVSLQVRAEPTGSRSADGITALDGSVLRPTGSLQLAETVLRLVPGPRPLLHLGRLMRIAEVWSTPDPSIEVTTVFSHVPVHARVDFRPESERAGTTRTSVAVTLGVNGSDLAAAGVAAGEEASAELVGGLTSVDEEPRTYSLTGSFSPEAVARPFQTGRARRGPDLATQVFQAVSSVPPGRYLLEVSYENTHGPVRGSVRDFIEVPLFSSDRLTVSSIILSSRLEELDSPAPGGASPFVLGRYRVVPRTSRVYAEPEELTIFYQVYGASRGADHRARLEVSYQFYLEDADSWLPIGAPIVFADETDLSQAWRVPLRGWPSGRYRLEVSVKDRLQKAEARREVLFEIALPDA